MSKLAIIVDAQKDFAALKARFKDTFEILKTDGPRAHNVSEIVFGAKKQIAILKALSYSDILILLDYDARHISYTKFLKDLTVELRSLAGDVHVAAPNATIENWYLADIAYLSKKNKRLLKKNLKQRNYEGKNGKAELRKLIQKTVTYNEVMDGAQLFKLIRFPVARANSRSFSAFYEIVSRYSRPQHKVL